MKRLTTAILTFLLIGSLLAGCGGRSTEPDSTDPVDQPAAGPSVDVIPSYTMNEAMLNNGDIADADVTLVQFATAAHGTHKAVIQTTMGDLEIILFEAQAPNAVKSFVIHAREGYYNGLTFDKILNNFVVEGGDPTGSGGESALLDSAGNPAPFANEYSLDLWHFRGAVSMSRLDSQAGNGSRFFMVQAPFVDKDTLEEMEQAHFPAKVIEKYTEIGGTPGFDWKRTVFGVLTPDSLKVLDTIALTPVDEDGLPENSVLIENVTITELTPTATVPTTTVDEDEEPADE